MMLLALLLTAAQAGETPRAYVQRLYASYRDPNFNPLAHPERYFAPRLVAALKDDARVSHGEVGYVDGDPICQCQDPSGLHASLLKVTQSKPGQATAHVSVEFPESTPRQVRFSLVRTAAGWRIADISAPDEPSFLHGIEASNRKARAKR